MSGILDTWDEHALYLSLAGPVASRGLFMVSAEVLAAIVEVQTVGRVTNRVIPLRHTTAVDAALASHVVDAWLAAVAEMRQGPDAVSWRQSNRIRDARAGKLALEDGVFEVETVHLSLGNGARSGYIRLYLPAGVSSAEDSAISVHTQPLPIREVEAELEAVLTRVTVPLVWFRDAGPETLIPISSADLGRMTLETTEGQVIMRGRLGRVGGWKAVRLGAATAEEHGTHPSGIASGCGGDDNSVSTPAGGSNKNSLPPVDGEPISLPNLSDVPPLVQPVP